MSRSISIALLAGLAATGCEADDSARTAGAGVAASESAPSAVEPEHFDLERAADLVRNDQVKDGAELERALNRDGRNRVDVDGDGKRDHLQVVESREPNARRFEVRALPSSKRRAEPDAVAVPVATFGVIPVGGIARVTVEYADVVVVEDPPVIAFNAKLEAGRFCHWVLVDRPVFVGTAYVVVHREHREHRKHRKHRKHKKFKHRKFKHRKFKRR